MANQRQPAMSDSARSAAGDTIVIIGGGLAGLFCALKLAPRPVTIVTAAPIGEGASSAWAQAGIAAAVAEGDTAEAHARDTIAAGAGIVDEQVARDMTAEAAARIHDLLEYGVPFDKDLAGRLQVSREAAHSARRIVHVKGDLAGRAIMQALVDTVRKTASIHLIERAQAEELLVDDGAVRGVRIRHHDQGGTRRVTIPARAVVLATGGIGHLYAVTTNPPQARGTGLAIAARAGAVIADPEFVQFHPTAINIGRDPAPLASEALRGEGATLVNSAGERFMLKLDPAGELAPRDIVARGVFAEIAAGRGAFLDTRDAIGASFPQHFPTVYQSCIEAGIDPVRDLIPVTPAEHYHMGGVKTDARGRSSLTGLWAAGEVASTGAHGANRLASNSLLEAVVFADRIAKDIAQQDWPALNNPTGFDDAASSGDQPGCETSEQALRQLMAAHVGVIRNGNGLAQALAQITRIEQSSRANPALHNMAVAALLIAAAAFRRRESRGAHFRSDYPHADPNQAHRTFLTLAEARAIAAEATANAARLTQPVT